MNTWLRGIGRLACALLIGTMLAVSTARAHEVRPAYLELEESAPGAFSVLWRTPVLAGMRLPITLKLPEGVRNLKEPVVQELTDSLVERRWINAGPDGLAGKRIEIAGLQLTITDVLVRVKFMDGRTLQTLVRPAQPWVEIAASQGPFAVFGSYATLGVEPSAIRPRAHPDRAQHARADMDDYRIHAGTFNNARTCDARRRSRAGPTGRSGDCAQHRAARR